MSNKRCKEVYSRSNVDKEHCFQWILFIKPNHRILIVFMTKWIYWENYWRYSDFCLNDIAIATNNIMMWMNYKTINKQCVIWNQKHWEFHSIYLKTFSNDQYFLSWYLHLKLIFSSSVHVVMFVGWKSSCTFLDGSV